ncbi:acetamidase/formamidase family protein [Planococcus sp. YIM B11945]|uniref:acetamidase/formamidase family protein n=1 Tax=Planococcus sp. YIM B11945 TaxID=3435410 RepID=UPI003D7C6FA0
MTHFPSTNTITSFSKEHKPAYFAELGKEIAIETMDCYDGQVKSETDLRSMIDMSRLNPATGPIYLNGVQAGDTLCIEILDIETNDFGVMMAAPGLGPLGEHVTTSSTKIIPIKNRQIQFSETLTLPLQPMIGVAGVAPENEAVPTAIPGSHGGNLDTKDIKPGNKLYLPVFHDGALAGFGDLHASMGDGELSGTGIEVSGRIKVRFDKVSLPLSNPMVEDEQFLYFLASGPTYDEAIQTVLFETAHHLKNGLNLSFEDAYRLMSAVCDLKFSQIVNKHVTVRVAVPKAVLPLALLLRQE